VEVQKPPYRPGQRGITILASYQPAWDEAEEVIGVSVAVTDMTDHRRAQEALRESEYYHRHSFELNSRVQRMKSGSWGHSIS
jgi:hypothetical protein